MYLNKDGKKQADKLVKDIIKEYKGLKKIKVKTVIEEFKKFVIVYLEGKL